MGGALNSRGMNGEGLPWRVAIQKPTDKENAVQAVVDINGHGISTSGSYRNYYELDGKRLSHVIDPQTGRPIEHNLVSVTVIAPTALEADARDTGLMVLGPEKAKEVVRREGLAVYMITKEGDSFKTRMSPQFKSFLVSEKLKRKIVGFCVMVTGQPKGYPNRGADYEKATCLTDDQRWQSVLARDPNADGEFVFAVRTTGIFCRPSCRARHALRENVSFYANASEALAAGFRPCKRCQPEKANAQQHRLDKITHACRLLEQETPVTLEALADRWR